METKKLFEFWFRLTQWKPSSAFMVCPQNNCRWSNVEACLHYLYYRQFKGICSPSPQFANLLVPTCTAFPRLQQQRELSLFNITVPSGASGLPRAVKFHAACAWRWTAVQVPLASQMRVGSSLEEWGQWRNETFMRHRHLLCPCQAHFLLKGELRWFSWAKLSKEWIWQAKTQKSEWGKQWVLSLPCCFFGEACEGHKKEFSLEVHIHLPYR